MGLWRQSNSHQCQWPCKSYNMRMESAGANFSVSTLKMIATCLRTISIIRGCSSRVCHILRRISVGSLSNLNPRDPSAEMAEDVASVAVGLLRPDRAGIISPVIRSCNRDASFEMPTHLYFVISYIVLRSSWFYELLMEGKFLEGKLVSLSKRVG